MLKILGIIALVVAAAVAAVARLCDDQAGYVPCRALARHQGAAGSRSSP